MTLRYQTLRRIGFTAVAAYLFAWLVMLLSNTLGQPLSYVDAVFAVGIGAVAGEVAAWAALAVLGTGGRR